MIAKHRSAAVFGVVALLAVAGCGSSSKELDASVAPDAAVTDAAMVEAINGPLRRHVHGCQPNDDQTIVAVKCHDEGGRG